MYIKTNGTKIYGEGELAAVHPVEVWAMWAEIASMKLQYKTAINQYSFVWNNPKLRNDVQ